MIPTIALVAAVVAVALAVFALLIGFGAKRTADRARSELSRHRYSHSLGRDTDPPARRHGGADRGPTPPADPDAAPATTELRAQRPDPEEPGEPTAMLPLPGRIGRRGQPE